MLVKCLKMLVWATALALVGCGAVNSESPPDPTEPAGLLPDQPESEKASVEPDADTPKTPSEPAWQLVWSDEFDGAEIDRTKWTFDKGGHGWGNDELQYYTDRSENARIEDGCLIIEARQEAWQGRSYTSARLKTQGLHSWTYGRIEARIQLPFGQGIWPAFWMLGDKFSTSGWPACGEIDIMEYIGKEPAKIFGTLHGPGYSGGRGVGLSYSRDGLKFADDFHVYAVEWHPEDIRWFVDDELYLIVTPEMVSGDWVYDHPFFILLNVAVGGHWPGSPDATTIFPQVMRVDYVRVYK